MQNVFTIKEVAEKLKISEWKVRDLIAQKEIAFFQIGDTYRITEEAVNEYITAKTVPASKKRIRFMP